MTEDDSVNRLLLVSIVLFTGGYPFFLSDIGALRTLGGFASGVHFISLALLSKNLSVLLFLTLDLYLDRVLEVLGDL